MQAESAAQMLDVLDEQIRCARSIVGTLTLENEALRKGDADRLNTASTEKAQLVEALETLEQERRALTALEAGAARGAEAQSKWRELLGLIAQCKERNQRNGVLVKARWEQVATALKTLRGAESELYDAKGLGREMPNRHRLGSA